MVTLKLRCHAQAQITHQRVSGHRLSRTSNCLYVTVGRRPDSDILMLDPRISRRQLIFTNDQTGQEIYLQNYSKNVIVLVNRNKRIGFMDIHRLSDGDEISFIQAAKLKFCVSVTEGDIQGLFFVDICPELID